MRDSEPSSGRLSLSTLNQLDDPDRQVRIWLLSAADVKGTTFYRIAGRFQTSLQTWQVDRRYSEFLMLRDTLVKYFSRATDTCPGCLNYLHAIKSFSFPKKHMFVSKSRLVINYRIKALRSFMNLLASWSFSNSPKCPTCGGFAFEIVRNFVVEGAEPVGESNMSYIRDSFVVSTFTNADRRSSLSGTPLSLRGSFTPGSNVFLSQRQESARNRRLSHDRNTVGGGTTDANAVAYETFNDYLGQQPRLSKTSSGRSTINTPNHQDPVSDNGSGSSGSSSSSQDRKYGKVRSGSYNAYASLYPEPTKPKRAARAFSMSAVAVVPSSIPEKHTVRIDRTENDSYISLAASNTSVEPEEYMVMVPDNSVASSRQGPHQKQGYYDSFVDSYVSDSFADESLRFDGMPSDVVDKSDDELDVTGVDLGVKGKRPKASSADGLWQPWELAKYLGLHWGSDQLLCRLPTHTNSQTKIYCAAPPHTRATGEEIATRLLGTARASTVPALCIGPAAYYRSRRRFSHERVGAGSRVLDPFSVRFESQDPLSALNTSRNILCHP
ncbi:hypothetical protein Poli38472_000646 [Pythium oligandrum]|uniref:PX domain-containing protein n=1 Tax=Pythium oligandrum TaxID=41045 RepID=A0A8K1CCN5_PYTOL|nr:hypothetical protein Poli38472_000646 [Pythium oligandrum]|eukprot:TMW60604.1 hypothetical protein Poli38472_000646 [Pythium oligandrum]